MTTTSEGTPEQGADRERQVRRIFSEIAPRYDLLNHLLSLNIDRRWRRQAVDRLEWRERPDGTYLDACAGTYDLALELTGRQGFSGSVVASDFAHPMLVQGLPKLEDAPVQPVSSDSLRLPFPDAAFDGAMVAFGVRNLADHEAGFHESARVLKPGARLVILEFSTPPNTVLRPLYLFYFHRVLPRIGRIISGHPWAYTYLPESVRHFPGPERMADQLRDHGFEPVTWEYLTVGIAAIHVGVRAGS